MRQRARPVDVIDGRMRVLVVGQVDVLHGENGQLVGPHRIATMFHVSGDCKQLTGCHNVSGRVDNDLVSSLEGNRIILAKSECIQGAIWRILCGALQSQVTSARGEFIL